jgi:hypothetical protein
MTGTNNANGFYFMGVYRTNSNIEPVYKIESYKTIKSDGGDIPVENERHPCARHLDLIIIRMTGPGCR